MEKIRAVLTVALLSLLLAACGGSGSGGGGGGGGSSGSTSTGMVPDMTGGTDNGPTQPPMPSDSMTPKELISMLEAARAIPRLGARSVTQSSNTDSSNVTTDTVDARFDYGEMSLTVNRRDGTGFSLDSSTDALATSMGTPVRSGQIAHEWSLQGNSDNAVTTARVHGEAPTDEFPLRAIHAAGNWATNSQAVRAWEASDRKEPLIPLYYIDHLKSLNVDQVGLSVALHYDDSMDSTVERVYSGVEIPTFTDDALRQFIREFRSHGIDVYLTLAFEAMEAETAERPVRRWQLGDPGHSETGVPPDDPNVFGRISTDYWPWNPDHPDHRRFVAEFFRTLTDQAVHFARIAQEEGVRLYSLGTETDRLFRTRPGGYFSNDFRQHLESMVSRVRAVYSGRLTYDMHYDALQVPDFYGPGSDHLWEDLGLDIVGVSAYFPLADSPSTTVMSVETLQAAWERIFREHLIPLARENPGRPVVFLEHGAPDIVEAPASPGTPNHGPSVFSDTNGNGLDDGQETQANMYQALLNTMNRYPGVVDGVFWWDNWITTDTGWAEFWRTHRSYSIHGKLAEDVLGPAYESWADWMTAGYWMHVGDDMELVDAGAFVDGPELNGTPALPSLGSATWRGYATGGFAAVYGTDFPNATAGSHEVGEYEGSMRLTADFGARRISGKVSSLSVSGIHTPAGGGSRPFADVAVPYEFNLGSTGFDEQGFTGTTTVTSTDPGIGIADSGGSWGGKFSIVPDGDGNPRVVAGTHGEEFTTDGGTRAGFIGAFVGVSGQ